MAGLNRHFCTAPIAISVNPPSIAFLILMCLARPSSSTEFPIPPYLPPRGPTGAPYIAVAGKRRKRAKNTHSCRPSASSQIRALGFCRQAVSSRPRAARSSRIPKSAERLAREKPAHARANCRSGWTRSLRSPCPHLSPAETMTQYLRRQGSRTRRWFALVSRAAANDLPPEGRAPISPAPVENRPPAFVPALRRHPVLQEQKTPTLFCFVCASESAIRCAKSASGAS
jgi:hypothetical protein